MGQSVPKELLCGHPLGTSCLSLLGPQLGVYIVFFSLLGGFESYVRTWDASPKKFETNELCKQPVKALGF